jgi:hypothetical protein
VAETTTLYLLHFDPPYAVPVDGGRWIKTAGHYLGSTGGDVDERVALHLRGQGSPLVRAAVDAGCAVELVAIGAGGRKEEREIKRHRHLPRWCPRCSTTPKPLSARDAVG